MLNPVLRVFVPSHFLPPYVPQFRIQDLTGTFFGKVNGPVRVNPISLYRWTEMRVWMGIRGSWQW